MEAMYSRTDRTPPGMGLPTRRGGRAKLAGAHRGMPILTGGGRAARRGAPGQSLRNGSSTGSSPSRRRGTPSRPWHGGRAHGGATAMRDRASRALETVCCVVQRSTRHCNERRAPRGG